MPRTLIAAFPGYARASIAPLLPVHVEPRWFKSPSDAVTSASEAEIAWLDAEPTDYIKVAPNLRWLFTLAAGVEYLPFQLMRDRGIRISNGSGLNAANVADYAVMGVIMAAKRYHEVLRAQDRREWLQEAPGCQELEGSRALIVGYGAIGEAVGKRLAPFGVQVTGVRSKADPARNILGPNDWRAQISAYDWIIVAAPSTSETTALIGRDEIAAMKPTAWLFNVGRGPLIARDSLIAALKARKIGGAFLDVTDPEPLPADDPLWTMPDAVITMHLSGRSQSGLIGRSAQFLVANIKNYEAGRPLENEVDLTRGY